MKNVKFSMPFCGEKFNTLQKYTLMFVKCFGTN